jgi:hypothetical protein
MNAKKTTWAALGLLAGLTLWTGEAKAANPAYLNINVQVTANLSVAVNGGATSTMTVAWNTATGNALLTPVSLASATVRNDSGGQTEKWALSTHANSLDTTGGSETWALETSSTAVGADEFTVQAVFGSSRTADTGCLAGAHADWNNSTAAPILTNTPTQYSATVFAAPGLQTDGTHQPDLTGGAANGRMFANSQRALCWRVVSPLTTNTVHTQNVQLVVTAQNP